MNTQISKTSPTPEEAFFYDSKNRDIVISISLSILKDAKKKFSTARIPITEALIRNRLNDTIISPQSLRRFALFIHYIAQKYEGVALYDNEYEIILKREYAENFLPKAEDTREPDYFGAIYFMLSIIISIIAAVWGFKEGFAQGVVNFMVLFMVACPLFLGLPIFFIALASDRIKPPKDLSILNILKTPHFWLYLLISILFAVAYTDCEYWYYTLLKVASCAVFVYSAVKFRLEWAKWIFGVLAVLYNPVLPVHLNDKEVWTAVNIATATFLWIALYIETKERNKNV